MNRSLKKVVIKRDGLVCQYCGIDVIEGITAVNGLVIEHVNGRSEDISNLCVSCKRCNSNKNRRTAVEWAASITESYILAKKNMSKVARIELLLSRLNQ
jgi:hypothetical protein